MSGGQSAASGSPSGRGTPERRRPERLSLEAVLHATSVEEVAGVLPSTGRPVVVPGYVRHEKLWSADLPDGFNAVPNKPAYVLNGKPLYPELLVVRLLERAGWKAAWNKRWGIAAFWRDIGEAVEPPAMAVAILDQVTQQAGHLAPWDIVAWRGRELRLLVSRTGDGGRLGAYLASWLDAALRMGIPLGCFAVVEHRSDPPPTRRRR